MPTQRKRHNTAFKTQVALAAIRQDKTTNELTTEYGVHATQIHNWEKQALSAFPKLSPAGQPVRRKTTPLKVTSYIASWGRSLPSGTG